MTYDQLVMLQSVVATGGFGRAARSLNISQPSVSNGIRKIEEEFGLVLFSRDQYRPKLTDEGRVFYEQSMRVSEEMHKLKDVGNQLAKKIEPIISIAVNDACPLEFLLDLLKHFFEVNKNTQLKLFMEGVRGASERVLNGDAHLGISPLMEDIESFESIPLGRIELVPVCSPEFPAAQLEDPPTERNMTSFTQVIIRDTSQKPDRNFGVVKGLRSSCTVNDHATKREIILKGLGWGRVPDFLIKDDLVAGRLVILESEEIRRVPLKMNVIRSRSKLHGPVCQQLWELFEKLDNGG